MVDELDGPNHRLDIQPPSVELIGKTLCYRAVECRLEDRGFGVVVLAVWYHTAILRTTRTAIGMPVSRAGSTDS